MGVSASTPGNMVLDAGVLAVGGTVIGATRGGATFNSNPTWRDPAIDNQPNPAAGTKRVISYAPTLTVVGLEFTDDLLDAAIVGGAATPTEHVVALSDYQTVTYTAVKGDGSSVTITLTRAICTNPAVAFANEDEGTVSMEFTGHYELSSRTPPFTIVVA